MPTTIRGTDSSASAPAITGADSDTGVYFPAANQVAIATNGTQALFVDSSQNVGIGTGSPGYKLDIVGTLSGGQVTMGVRNLSNTANSDARLYIEAYSNSRFSYTQYGVNGVGSWNTGYDVASGSYRISNDGGGSLNTNTKMVIASSGDLLVGQTSYTFGVNPTSTAVLVCGSLSVNANQRTTGLSGNTYWDTAGNLYRSTSSIKYKQNVLDMTYGLQDVLGLRPVTFENKAIENTRFAGFIAEEVQELGLTEFVAYDTEGNPDGLSYANMVALLTKAIQELNAKVEAQAAEIQILKQR